MVDDFQATKPGDVGPGGSGYSQFPQSKIPSTRAQPNGDKYAGVSFIKAIQGSDVLAESMGRDNSEFKTQEHNVYTQYEASPNKPKSHLHEIAPLRKDWTVGAPSKFTKHREEDEEGKRKEEDIAGDREGQVIANEGRQRAFTPSGADTLDQSSDSDTSTGDQEDYGASFDVNDDDLALNEEARRKRATKLVNRFLKAPTVGDAPGTSFSSPIQITEEEREDDDDELARRATKYDEEADELARKGYGPAAMLKREKAMKIRKRMNSPVRSTFKMYQDLVKYGKVQVDK